MLTLVNLGHGSNEQNESFTITVNIPFQTERLQERRLFPFLLTTN